MAMNFNLVFDFLSYIDQEGDFLEIGSERGDRSTPMLAMLAKHYNRKMYSVDIDPAVYQDAKKKYGNTDLFPIEFVNKTGEEFLDNIDKKFTLVLLDNFDWMWNINNPESFIQVQKDHYAKNFNLEMSNINSQKAHLIQAIKLAPKLTKRAIIICDDTVWLKDQGIFSGKCGAAIPFLLSKGFTIGYQADFGVILVRNV